MRQRGIDAARHLEKSCRAAAKHHRQVMRSHPCAAVPGGNSSPWEMNDSEPPFFCCLAAGRALLEVAGLSPWSSSQVRKFMKTHPSYDNEVLREHVMSDQLISRQVRWQVQQKRSRLPKFRKRILGARGYFLCPASPVWNFSRSWYSHPCTGLLCW